MQEEESCNGWQVDENSVNNSLETDDEVCEEATINELDTNKSIKRQRALRRYHVPNSFKTNLRTDWKDDTQCDAHFYFDCSSSLMQESCYLSIPEAIEFHKLEKCQASSKSTKKRCYFCKIVVHEECVDRLQMMLKCRVTFVDYHEKLYKSGISHHWILRKQEEDFVDNKCFKCLKALSTSRVFSLPSVNTRLVLTCTWCKKVLHLRCFNTNEHATQECLLNEFIVPPSWINKIKRRSLKSSTKEPLNSENNNINNNTLCRRIVRSFIVRPSMDQLAHAKPLIVLINPKSGGTLGSKLLRKFMWLLNPRQVFDLNQFGSPKFALELYRNTTNLRILVGGGDGTVGWVLSVMDLVYFREAPSIAVLPLGTGNDLSRALNWGSGYTDESLVKILQKVSNSRQVMLDRWKIKIEQNYDYVSSTQDSSETSSTSLQSFRLKNDVMNNYFSIGADAHVCLEFHSKREANPEKFNKRWINKLQYLEAGSRDLIKQSWKDLSEYTHLECDGVDYTSKIKSRAYHCLIFLNISKYSSGTNPWGTHTSASFRTQAYDDGFLEVIGCFTGTLTKLQLGGYGERLCQAKHIKLVTNTEIPMQIDGEPFKVPPSIIEITLKNQVQMLECVKCTKTLASNQVELSDMNKLKFEIKCISMSDYQINKTSDYDKLANALGCMEFYPHDLLKNVREQIEGYFKFIIDLKQFPLKWSFLNAQELFIENNEYEQTLLDIVQNNDIILIDETVCVLDVDEVDASGEDLQVPIDGLMSACKDGNLKYISKVENLSVVDEHGMSLLHYASVYGYTDIAQYVAQRVSTEFINFNQNSEKQTALHFAIENNHKTIVKLLLEHGTDIDLKNLNGDSSRLIIEKSYNPKLVKILREFLENT